MKDFEIYIVKELKRLGVDLIDFVDISGLDVRQNKKLPHAILFGIALTPKYIKEVASTTNYVQTRINNNLDFDNDELCLTEMKVDKISDYIASLIISKKYKAYSLSDSNQIETGFFDGQYGETPLPHKTIAVLSGIGWIGKNNLLITPDFGSAICLGAVLTDIPLNTTQTDILKSNCEKCNICLKVCETNALQGCLWNNNVKREDMIDVYKCTTCMKCLVHCKYTTEYINKTDY